MCFISLSSLFFIVCLLTHCRLVNKKRTLLQTEQVSMYPVCAKGYFFPATRRTRNTKNASSHFLLTSSPEKGNSFLAKRTFMLLNPIEEFLNCGNIPVFLCFRLK